MIVLYKEKIMEEQFKAAAVKSKSLPAQSNDNLLALYALYKQASEGDVSGDKPGMFDFKGVAKYNAWESKKGMSKEDAMKAYVELVDKLGS